MRVVLMIEGQEGVSWDEWVALARACEEHGLEGLFRSDHYQSVFDVPAAGRSTPGRRSPALAAVTERIRLGTMVSPATFRRPSVLARDGRDRRPRLGRPRRARARRRLEPGTSTRRTASRSPTSPSGWRSSRSSSRSSTGSGRRRSSRSRGATTGSSGCRAEPKPVQQPHPPIVMGGAAGPRVARLAARWADEYNTPFASVEDCRERRARIVDGVRARGARADRLLADERRAASAATGPRCSSGPRRRLRAERSRRRPRRSCSAHDDKLVGTVGRGASSGSRDYAEAGVERVFLQHLDHADLDMVRLIGEEIVPAFD